MFKPNPFSAAMLYDFSHEVENGFPAGRSTSLIQLIVDKQVCHRFGSPECNVLGQPSSHKVKMMQICLDYQW